MADTAYLDTLARMEPGIALVDRDAALASMAISLKRIADAVDRCASAKGLFALISEVDRMVDAAARK